MLSLPLLWDSERKAIGGSNMKSTETMGVELAKLHVVVPKPLFDELKRRGLLKDIDNLVSQYLVALLQEEQPDRRRVLR
jgi:hypothetical protein